MSAYRDSWILGIAIVLMIGAFIASLPAKAGVLLLEIPEMQSTQGHSEPVAVQETETPPRSEGVQGLLVAAAYMNRVNEVRSLLRSGARPVALKRGRYAPIHAAAEGNSVATLRVLLQAGARINAIHQSPKGPRNTALDLAIRAGSTEAAEYLRSKGGLSARMAPKRKYAMAAEE